MLEVEWTAHGAVSLTIPYEAPTHVRVSHSLPQPKQLHSWSPFTEHLLYKCVEYF